MLEAAESCVRTAGRSSHRPTRCRPRQLDARDVGRSAQTARSSRRHTPRRNSKLHRTRLALPPLYPGEGVASALRWCAAVARTSGGRISAGASHSLAASADGATFVWGGCARWDHDDDAPAVGFLGLGELDDIEAAGDTGLAIVTRPRRVDLWKETAVAEVCAARPQRRSRTARRRVVLGRRVHRSPGRHARAPGCRRSAPQRPRRRRRWRRRRRADGGAPCSRPTPLALGVRIVGASCGAFHTLLLAEGGGLLSSAAARGQLGHGDRRDRATPTAVETERLVKESGRRLRLCDVSAGAEHSVAVSDDGVAYTWGDGLWGSWETTSSGGTATRPRSSRRPSTPPPPASPASFRSRRWCATTWCAVGGAGGRRRCSHRRLRRRRERRRQPHALFRPPPWLHGGPARALLLRQRRTRQAWPWRREGPPPADARHGDAHGSSLSEKGRRFRRRQREAGVRRRRALRRADHDRKGLPGCGSNGRCARYWNRLYPDRRRPRRHRGVAAGEEHTLARAAGGTLYAFGANGSGQLGIGGAVDEDVPEEVALP